MNGGKNTKAQWAVIIALITLIVWSTGFLRFIHRVSRFEEPAMTADLPATDAIVVLTGGSERLQTGIDLLEAGKGRKLLISGVPQGVSQDHVLSRLRAGPDLRACCIILGHAADNTLGNAEETSVWMASESYQSLRLVTAHYHMPRSLLVFRAQMPSVTMTPHPVFPDSVHLNHWWTRPGTASLLAMEYCKYLIAFVRIRLGV